MASYEASSARCGGGTKRLSGRLSVAGRWPGESGKTLYYEGFIEDITERKRVDQALRRSEERFRTIVETAEEGIAELDSSWRIAFANRKLADLLGYTAGELRGVSLLDLLADGQGAPHEAVSGGAQHAERLFRRKDGSRLWAIVSYSRLRGAGPAPQGGLAMVADVSARKRVEEQVRLVNLELRKLSGELLRSQDEERRRIARELHDSTAQLLSGISMSLSSIQPAEIASERAARYIEDCLALAGECSRELRTLSYLLHPPLLDELGLASALEQLAEGFRKRTLVEVDIAISPGFGRLPRDVETTLFRIVQEALANVRRHASANRVTIGLERTAAEVRLEIGDDGCGFPPSVLSGDLAKPAGLGVGILGMRERAGQLGGSLALESAGGAVIRVALPLVEAV